MVLGSLIHTPTLILLHLWLPPTYFLMPHKSTCNQNYAKSQDLTIQRPRDKFYLSVPLGLSNSKNTKWNISSLINQSSSSFSSTGKWTTSSQMLKLKIWEHLCSFSLNLSIHNRYKSCQLFLLHSSWINSPPFSSSAGMALILILILFSRITP